MLGKVYCCFLLHDLVAPKIRGTLKHTLSKFLHLWQTPCLVVQPPFSSISDAQSIRRCHHG